MAKRVCVLTCSHKPYDNRINKEIRSLINLGYEVIFVAPFDENYKPLEEIKYIPIKPIGVNVKKDRFSRLMELLKKALEVNADIYHFHDPEILLLALRLKKGGKKVIYDVHENYPGILRDTRDRFLGHLLGWFFEKFENFVTKRIDGFVTVNEELFKRFSKLSIGALVPNYFDTSILRSIKIPEKSYTEKVRFVYSGSIHESRAIIEIMKAYKKLREKYDNVSLRLIGPMRDKNILEFIEQNKLKDFERIHQLPYEEALFKAAECDVGLAILKKTSNSKFASPNKIFEYAALGLPIITSNIDYLKEKLKDFKCVLYVEPDDIDDIYSKMEFFVKNKNILQEFQEDCKRIVEKYNWKICEKNLGELYSRIINN